MTVALFYSLLFVIGGCAYPALELLWRGRTHISMAVAGGICLVLMCAVCRAGASLPFVVRCLICAAVVTAVEFAVGVVVNIRLKLGVWDYSDRKYNLKGQICAEFVFVWVLLSALVAAANEISAAI